MPFFDSHFMKERKLQKDTDVKIYRYNTEKIAIWWHACGRGAKNYKNDVALEKDRDKGDRKEKNVVETGEFHGGF